ncbi:MAG TPA: class I adenylate-forming enzyme family protein [Caulobacteraceae bacterium]|jgi:acyl-CoA synthetase (AMP-forming)/AMP-acid ligase II
MIPIDVLYRQATDHPDVVAFIWGNDAWSYRRLADDVERAAQGLLARGVRSGDRVALHMANRPEMAIAYYACFRIGAIAAPMNLRFKFAELRQIFQRLRPALYIGEASLYSQVEPIESEVLNLDARFVAGPISDGHDVQAWWQLISEGGDRPLPDQPGADEPAVLLTTSGTTGQPKLVVHTAETLSAMIGKSTLELNGQQTAVVATPMVHASGLFSFLSCIGHAAPMVLLERFCPDAVLDAIETHRCTWMLGLAFMYHAMLERQRTQPRQADSLKFCFAGGDVMPTSLQGEFEQEFRIPLRNIWGATEANGSLTYGLRPGPVCRIAPGAEVRLVDAENRDVPHGEAGELLLRGPNVTPGYWVGPNLVEDPKHDGWLRTGDLMRRGEADEVWFVGRCKQLIVRAGSNIAPVEVETALSECNLVRDAAVVGVPDPVLGERVAGLVQLQPGAGVGALDRVLADVKTRLADYKVPERLIVVEAVPRNPLGKIDRKLAAAMAADLCPVV